ncbi:peptidase S41 [uncultured Anaerococcus sp.]|uniref:peptidase S41 n=1 Tax=uncultured Anaerococcus sp. TaxID=293428 RepID=UPI0025F797E6|nr:peptidase S41 [uncultured Anaerococcus sp.]
MRRKKINKSRRKNVNHKRNRDIRKSEIRIVKDEENLSSREKKRRKRRRRQRERLYRKRRMALLACSLLIILIPSFLIIKKINTYGKMGYPDFRDEVLEDLSSTAFVSSTEGRSLTSAEKKADFDKIYETIVLNFAVDKRNYEYFEEFNKKSDEYRKKITNSKTDQDFFLLLNEYLKLLDDPVTSILDKDSYEDFFNYYKNKDDSAFKEVLENQQAINRYKRIIKDKNTPEASVAVEKGNVLRISLTSFKISDLGKIIDQVIEAVTTTPGITNILIDLSENSSLNYLFVNEFSKYFIHQDYIAEELIFYRGKLLDNTLKDIKADDSSYYQTAFVKNDALKYKENPEIFDKDYYLYYDQVSLNIKKDPTFASRNIYVLTNQNTANSAINLASIFKEAAGGYIVKNGLDPNPTSLDRIYKYPVSFFVLDHSGLIISLNTAREISPNTYLEYDQRINAAYPIESMLDIIN